ncbi:IS3 family transposase [Bacillus pseudomycoides]
MQDYNYDRYQWTLKKIAPVQYRNHLFECLIFKGLFIKLSIL